jgi:hypothetical protein
MFAQRCNAVKMFRAEAQRTRSRTRHAGLASGQLITGGSRSRKTLRVERGPSPLSAPLREPKSLRVSAPPRESNFFGAVQ